MVRLHSDMRVIRLGLRRREKDKARLDAGSKMRATDELAAYPTTLKRYVDS